MSKFTPGPWAPMAGMPTNILGSKAYRVARCDFDGDFDHAEAHASARLIAAAPALYEALEDLLADIENYQTINLLNGYSNVAQINARAALALVGGGE